MVSTAHRIVFAAALLVAASACGGGHRIEATLAPGLPDLRLVDMVEVRDAKGQVLVSGKFATSSETSGEIVRRAALTNPGNDDWEGVVEMRIERDGDGASEADDVRLRVEDLPDDTPCVVMFDTLKVADFVTDDDGEADVRLRRESLAKTYN
jgi:hypothetical protein